MKNSKEERRIPDNKKNFLIKIKSLLNMKSPSKFLFGFGIATTASLFFMLLKPLHAAGIAALKEQSFHNDTAAKPLVYSEMKDQGAPFVSFQVKGKAVIIDKTKIAAVVEVPSGIPNQIIDENGIAPLRASLKDMADFTRRFPQMESILSNHIGTVSNHIKMFDSGRIRYEGKWISKKEYDDLVKRSQSIPENLKSSDTAVLTTLSENKYFAYKKTSADINGVKIMHREGFSIIPWDDLSEDLKKEFGYLEVVKGENDRKIAEENRIRKLRADLNNLLEEAKAPVSDWRAVTLCEQYINIKRKLGETNLERPTSSEIRELFGKPDDTSILPDSIELIILVDAEIWHYKNRLRNSTTDNTQELKFMFLSGSKEFIGVRNQNDSGRINYNSERMLTW